MDIGGVGSTYADYMMTSQASKNKADTLQNKLSSSSASAEEKELKEACKEFESYFVEQVFQSMMKTAKVFSDDQELCGQVTDGDGLGLANTLYEQMKRNYGIGVVQPEELLEE